MGQDTQTLSPATVEQFMSLDEGSQRKALGGMSPEAKQALLAGVKSKSQPQGMTPPPESTFKKVARGAALGGFEGVGVAEGQTAGEVLKGTARNVGTGLATAAKEGFLQKEDPYNMVGGVPKIVSPFGVRPGSMLDAMAKGVERSGAEAWKGYKTKDPELFAHGLASTITQILTLGYGKRQGKGALKAGKDLTAAKLGAAIDITGEHVGDLKTALPDIVDEAKKRGVGTVGELRDTVKTASGTIDQEFNTALAPIANRSYVPVEIARRIRNLITPDMAKTAEGRDAIREINQAARDYEKPWTYQELNSKRMTENSNLNSFFNKDTRGQAASKLQTDISKAVRDGAADIVYQGVDQANPGFGAKNLKARQGALWGLSDFLTEKVKDLEAKQLKHEGRGPIERLGAHGYVSGAGKPHAYISGLGEMFSEGAGAAADAKVRSALFPSKTAQVARGGATALKNMGRVTAASLPIDALVGKEENKRRGGLESPPKLDE